MRTQFATVIAEILCLALMFAVHPGCRRAEDTGKVPEVIRTKSGLDMVVIPGGWFEMGSDKAAPDESPAHRVWVSSFLMDTCEVVQEQFKKFQFPDPSHFKNPQNPLEQINWTDAAMYCNERSLSEGLEPCYDEETWDCNFTANGYRLPTEAEWEYACRAGTKSEYSFGNDARRLRDYAWFTDNSSGKTHPVGQKKPNPWGLHDMHGNAAEWCNDYYSENYYSQAPQQDPRGPREGKERVLRGGAWNSSAEACRSAYRTSDPSIDDTCLANDAIGFRCVRKRIENLSSEPNMPNENSPQNATTGLIYDDIYIEHKTTPGHPERPERLVKIIAKLKASGLYSQLHMLKSAPAALDWIQTVHSPEYIERAQKSSKSGAGYLDSLDVPISRQSYEAAVMAAGGILAAVDAVMTKEVENAFCAVRPPGHHAMEDRAMGFCIFNNVAIGTRYVQKKYGVSKVLIVDWDVHHGNGTQAEFYDDPTVLYFSVHQYPFYPGTGSEAEKGDGKGFNHNINAPLPAGSGDSVYLKVFEEELKPAALAFGPEFVFISAGFDAHENDLLGGMKVTAEGFAQLTRIVKTIARKCCQGRLVSVLEGGYHLGGLAASVESHIRVLMR
ncbi:MAG: SUMF1/EgtB/PvdO family nonheme iron enzyme [Phycisphaerales bacterium]|nr:MAG: SUMF1/EgtB/PvdO family nonheme iron enzyme [Phycisphaerales bacterium]